MATGIFGATLDLPVDGTTAHAGDMTANDQALKTNGVNNDGGAIATDGAGNVTLTSVSNASGRVCGLQPLTTPYDFVSNGSNTAGATIPYQITGNGTPAIPANATWVLVAIYGVFAAATGYFAMNKQGGISGTPTHNTIVGQAQGGNNTVSGTVLVPLNTSNGKIDLYIGNQNVSGVNATVIAFMA